MVNFAIELGAGNRTLVEEELMQTLNFEILLAKVWISSLLSFNLEVSGLLYIAVR